MRNKSFKALVLMVLLINYTYSQEFVPPIQNYLPSQYSGASQNWDIELDDRGVVYTANNQGLLVFDGISWELFPLESEAIIRSVYPYKGRIYTGSYNEFGYWETLANGCMVYNSLIPLMQEFNLQNDEFWEIMAYEDAIYFRSFGAVYKYEDNSVTQIKDLNSTTLGLYNGNLIFSPRMNGLKYLDKEGNLQILDGDLTAIENVYITDTEALGDKMFIAGKKALYVYDNKIVKPFGGKKVSEILDRAEIHHIISVSETEIILGTIKNGIIQYNFKDDHFQVYDRSSGLQNNTVLGMAYFKKKLWLALDKGIDVIDLHSPIKFYTDNSGELGAVYDLHIFEGNYYLASNTGVYSFVNGNLQLIENAGDHTWSLEEIDNVLYANHNTGIYYINDNQFIPIDNHTGSFTIKRANENSKNLLIGQYTGLSIYNTDTRKIRELNEINFPVKDIVLENQGTFWASHPYEGIYRISHRDFEDLKIKKIEPLGDNKNFNPGIYEINKQITAFVGGNWYKYNPFQDEFRDFTELKGFSDSELIYQGEFFSFVNSENENLIITDFKGKSISLGPEYFNYRLVKSNENFIRENDSTFYITLNDGFARINLNKLSNDHQNHWISEPFIKEFSDNVNRHSLDDDPIIDYKNSDNIILKAGMPASNATKLNYRLEGEETLTGTVKSGLLNFRNLKHGDYSLELTAVGDIPGETVSKKLDFTIVTPWYLALPMKVIYVLVVLSIVFLVYWLNLQKLKKHQLQLEAKFEKEHSERLNKIEKERLLHEIDLKRKELANTTMMAAKKNEVLMEIQGELNKDKNKFSNQFRIKHIMTKINNAVKNKDEWKVFEINFNEVHEDFFKDVLEKYPKLTSKDLKLCAYLKMNLSSKEIAPLMGISVRGVEVHRYRLRKKMELDSDVNLTKFLIKNF